MTFGSIIEKVQRPRAAKPTPKPIEAIQAIEYPTREDVEVHEDVEIRDGYIVLDLYPGDDIPTPSPLRERYSVFVTPELAEYLLTFNIETNRKPLVKRVARLVSDIVEGLWYGGSPQSVIFADTTDLINGSHRLTAIVDSGIGIWLVIDFGHDAEKLFRVLDQSVPRSLAAELKAREVPNAANVAASMKKVWAYWTTVGSNASWDNIVGMTVTQAINLYDENVALWLESARQGARIYLSTQDGLTKSHWASAYYVIAEQDPDNANLFFGAVVEGSGKKGDPARDLRDWSLRRMAYQLKTGDRREPTEVIIRAYNAWLNGKRLSKPREADFVLTGVDTI